MVIEFDVHPGDISLEEERCDCVEIEEKNIYIFICSATRLKQMFMLLEKETVSLRGYCALQVVFALKPHSVQQ